METLTCGCCFNDETLDKIVCCSEAHIFCEGCVNTYVENAIGQRIPIKCMNSEGNKCKGYFTLSVLERCVTDMKTLNHYLRMVARYNIVKAKISNFFECYCGNGVVIPEQGLRVGRIECAKCRVI